MKVCALVLLGFFVGLSFGNNPTLFVESHNAPHTVSAESEENQEEFSRSPKISNFSFFLDQIFLIEKPIVFCYDLSFFALALERAPPTA